jgi:hypothetical protein
MALSSSIRSDLEVCEFHSYLQIRQPVLDFESTTRPVLVGCLLLLRGIVTCLLLRKVLAIPRDWGLEEEEEELNMMNLQDNW